MSAYYMSIKLYTVSGSPPSIAVMMCLKALNLKYMHINFDYAKGQHRTDEFAKINPQKEVPVLVDEGFCLSESNAILQYLGDKYGDDDKLYPKELRARAIVNHRLCFDMSTYYKLVLDRMVILMNSEKDKLSESLIKIHSSLNVYDKYLERLGTKYAAGNNLTIADFQLITTTMCLEAFNVDISTHSFVNEWYETFKSDHPDLWKIAEVGMKELAKYFEELK